MIEEESEVRWLRKRFVDLQSQARHDQTKAATAFDDLKRVKKYLTQVHVLLGVAVGIALGQAIFILYLRGMFT